MYLLLLIVFFYDLIFLIIIVIVNIIIKVLHGDIALRNILLSEDRQRVTIIDVGLAIVSNVEKDFLLEEKEMKKELNIL